MENYRKSILWHIKQLRRNVFTTHELCVASGKSPSGVTQALNYLRKEGIIFKIYRGIWMEKDSEKVSPYTVIQYLLPLHRAYVSFVSALHLHGLIEQIPQTITLATTAHSKTIHTKIGTYHFHQLKPSFFDGFTWYKERGSFLIAEPEKALIDSLYLSTRKKMQFGHFPELHFPKSFDFKKAKKWIRRITDDKIRYAVEKKFNVILTQHLTIPTS